MACHQLKPNAKNPRRQAQASRLGRIEKRLKLPLRRSARLAHAREAKSTDCEPKRPLLSPQTSINLSKEHSPSPPPPRLEAIEVLLLPQEPEAGRKRKGSQEDRRPDSQDWHEPAEKRARITSQGLATVPSPSPPKPEAVEVPLSPQEPEDRRPDLQDQHESAQNLATAPEAAASDNDYSGYIRWIERWLDTIPEPEYSFDKGFKMSQYLLSQKRPFAAISHSQGVRDGIYPVAHTAKYEKQILKPARIILSQQIGDKAIRNDARELCRNFLNATYDIPPGSSFDGDMLWLTLDNARNEGEGDIVNNMQEDIVPLVYKLVGRGFLKIDYLKRQSKTLWNNVVSLAGPTSCPDVTVGLLPSAFTDVELDKLHRRYQSPITPANFTGDLYFPFFTCEAKCGASRLNESDRQNALSAATAINTILELYRCGEKARQEAGAASGNKLLHREVLYFSISHNHTIVKIFAHYPLIEDDKTHFHQHIVKTFDLSDDGGNNRWISYCFVRQLYDRFAPIHLQRIRDAILYLPEPGPEPEVIVPTISVDPAAETPKSQENIATSAAPSQDTAVFKKPRLSPKSDQLSSKANEAKLQEENNVLKVQVNALTQMQTLIANPGNDSQLVITMLRQELEHQRQDSERQRQEMKEENQGLQEQLEKQREEISKLTQSVLALAPKP